MQWAPAVTAVSALVDGFRLACPDRKFTLCLMGCCNLQTRDQIQLDDSKLLS
jgi:hypothetical protein